MNEHPWQEEELARQLHGWYLEGTQSLKPENYNPKAQVAYDEMNEEQKEIDRFIARKILALRTQAYSEGVKAEREESDDLLETMWGIICNVSGEQRQMWTDAMYRVRERYFKRLSATPTTHNSEEV
jgi:hypothetical protein